MIYKISYKNPHKRFIDIEFTIPNIADKNVELHIPSWRPGRYELQNYSKNIQGMVVLDEKGNSLPFSKNTKDSWTVIESGSSTITVKYKCYVYQMDAGGCWVDDEQLYLNFIFCLLYVVGREKEACEVQLILEPSYNIACGLKKNGHTLQADDYYQLIDCPMIASASMLHETFQIGEVQFNIWAQGSTNLNWEFVKLQFTNFAKEQIETMGDFPEKEYNFLYQFLPFKHHHGVEHRNSTIITLGPAEYIANDPQYIDFLSISCHELFHAWNIIKIRPREMMPYDLTKENYFNTGFIVEGITTYYGEYFLARSKVITTEQYFNELNLQFKKHFENYGNFNLSVAESSIDLWVDGYNSGTPNRKVSIYVKGSMIALIIDLQIRKLTRNEQSLDDVMRYLWVEYGKKGIGYTLDDFYEIIKTVSKNDMKLVLDECIFQKTDLYDLISSSLDFIGCYLETSHNRLPLEKYFGLRTCVGKDGKTVVESTDPGSPADHALTKDDEIVAVNSCKVSGNANDLIGNTASIEISYFRKNRLRTTTITADGKSYFQQYRIQKKLHPSLIEKENFSEWLKHEF